MTTQALKNKVISKLEKWGNNSEDVKKMVSMYFEEASKNYTSVNSIAEYIRTVY